MLLRLRPRLARVHRAEVGIYTRAAREHTGMRGARKTGAAHALQKGEIAVTTKKRYWAGTSAKLSAWAGTKSALWAGVGGGDGGAGRGAYQLLAIAGGYAWGRRHLSRYRAGLRRAGALTVRSRSRASATDLPSMRAMLVKYAAMTAGGGGRERAACAGPREQGRSLGA